MELSGVIDISRRGVFSLEEAQQAVSLLRKLTEKYVQEVENKMVRLESMNNDNINTIMKLEEEINLKIESWHNKVRKLGGEPKGLWLVDLDSGTGYYCWKYPEGKLQYWHEYQDGFKNRIPIGEIPEVSQKESISKEKNVVLNT